MQVDTFAADAEQTLAETTWGYKGANKQTKKNEENGVSFQR